LCGLLTLCQKSRLKKRPHLIFAKRYSDFVKARLPTFGIVSLVKMFNRFWTFQNSIVKQLITLHDVPPKNIMVLSPYLGQCNRLRKKLKETLKTLARNSFVSIQDGEPHVGSVVTSQGLWNRCE